MLKNIILKGKNGITLIALVVTIVILLILATVTINMTVSQNGLLSRAKETKVDYQISKEKEQLTLGVSSVQIGNADAKVTKTELQTEMNNTVKDDTVTVDGKENGPFYVTYNNAKRTYVVDSKYEISDAPDKAKGSGNLTDGDGTEANPILIQSVEDLATLSKKLNDSGNLYNFDGKYLSLNTDLDFDYRGSYINPDRTDFGDINGNGTVEPLITEMTTEKGFLPCNNEDNTDLRFKGIFNGNNYSINNLYENRNGNEGLFGTTDTTTIKNLKLKDVNIISSGSYVASIIGQIYNNITIDNCTVSGNIDTKGYSGGLIGYMNGTSDSKITNCINNINISFAGGSVGGIASGTNSKSPNNLLIENCKNNGSIISKDTSNLPSYTGGIMGDLYNSWHGGNIDVKNCENNGKIVGGGHVSGIMGRGAGGKIEYCRNYGNIYGETGTGGIIGYNEENGTIVENSINIGNIFAYSYMGGIVGNAMGISSISYCTNSGNILKNNEYTYSYPPDKIDSAAGIAGCDSNNISYCYNTGTVEGYSDIGGITGSGYSTIIDSCYNFGTVKGTFDIGGITGYGENNISNCYNSVNIDKESGDSYKGEIGGYVTGNVIKCFYLKSLNFKGIGNKDDATDVVEAVNTQEEIKNKIKTYFLSLSGFKDDTNNINNGYPIFSWQ